MAAPPASTYYFESKYLDPIFNQFQQTVDNRRNTSASRSQQESKLLRSETNLLKEKQRLLHEANLSAQNLQKRVDELLLQAPSTMQNYVIDPLFRFYMNTVNESSSGENNGAYPQLSYFIGLSYTMLQGFREMMTDFKKSCESALDYRQVNYKNCTEQFTNLLILVKRWPQLNDEEVAQQLRVQTSPSVFNKLWLVDELKDEENAQSALLQDLESVKADNEYYNDASLYNDLTLNADELKTELQLQLNSIQSDYDDSKLREEIILELRKEILPWMNMLFFEGVSDIPAAPFTRFTAPLVSAVPLRPVVAAVAAAIPPSRTRSRRL